MGTWKLLTITTCTVNLEVFEIFVKKLRRNDPVPQ